MKTRISAGIAGVLLAAGGLLTWLGKPEREVSFASAGELWADVLRDADQLGLQLTRMSDAEEMDLGRRLAQPYLQAPVAGWQSYVEAVGKEVAAHVSRRGIRYEFHVIDSGWVNAFALPGGQIFVFTGLLNTAKTESELAAVLGHEIAHVDARHCAERFQYEMKMAKLSLGDVGKVGDLMKAVLARGYGQHYELEADAIGLRLAAESGYDPRGAVAMEQRMMGQRGVGSTSQTPLDELLRAAGTAGTDWLRSHPPAGERARRLAALGRAYEGKMFYVGAENYRRRIPRTQQRFAGEETPAAR